MGIFSLPRLLSSSSTATLHLRRFSAKSVERVRNVWISGLIDPNKVTQPERSMLYTGDFEAINDSNYALVSNYALINILDSVDYNAVVESALPAFDGAIQVLSGVGGVESQSIDVDKQIIRYQLPRLIFINNIDQKGANPWQVLNQERSKLGHHSAAIQVPIGFEDDFKGLVDLVQLKAYSFHGSNGENVVVEEVPADMEASVLEKRRELIEAVSRVDDKLAEAFCSGRPISAADLQEAVRRVTIARKFTPVFMGGGAFRYKGLQLLLDGVLNYLPCPIEASNYSLDQSKNGETNSLVALAFTMKNRFCQGTYLRIYEGVIREGDFITNVNTGKTFEVPELIGLRNDELEVPPHSIEICKDKVPPYSIEVHKDKMGVPHVIGVRKPFREVQEAHPGEIVTLALPINRDGMPCEGETFVDGLVRYTKASIDVSESSQKIQECKSSKEVASRRKVRIPNYLYYF